MLVLIYVFQNIYETQMFSIDYYLGKTLLDIGWLFESIRLLLVFMDLLYLILALY